MSLRNALIAPFTVMMPAVPVASATVRRHRRGDVPLSGLWLHAGRSSVKNNDMDLLLACALVSVVVVLWSTQLSQATSALAFLKSAHPRLVSA
ncbi:MAG: hypothetical protein ACN6I5_08310 [Hyphomicrobiales bacterium]